MKSWLKSPFSKLRYSLRSLIIFQLLLCSIIGFAVGFKRPAWEIAQWGKAEELAAFIDRGNPWRITLLGGNELLRGQAQITCQYAVVRIVKLQCPWAELVAISSDGGRVLAAAGPDAFLLDGRTGKRLFTFSQNPWKRICRLGFCGGNLRAVMTYEDGAAVLCRRQRPEGLFGIAFMWEFWLVTAFAVALGLSLRSDRKHLGSPGAPPAASGRPPDRPHAARPGDRI